MIVKYIRPMFSEEQSGAFCQQEPGIEESTRADRLKLGRSNGE